MLPSCPSIGTVPSPKAPPPRPDSKALPRGAVGAQQDRLSLSLGRGRGEPGSQVTLLSFLTGREGTKGETVTVPPAGG